MSIRFRVRIRQQVLGEFLIRLNMPQHHYKNQSGPGLKKKPAQSGNTSNALQQQNHRRRFCASNPIEPHLPQEIGKGFDLN